MKGYAEAINGKCITEPPIGNNIGLLKELCIHAYNTSPTAGQPTQTGLFGCKNNTFILAGTGIEFLPYQFSDPSTILRAYVYGQETNTVQLKTPLGDNCYFTPADLGNIQYRNFVPPPYSNFSKAAGPPVSTDVTTTMLRRRLAPQNDKFKNRIDYSFVNALYSVPQDGQAICKLVDWLTFMHPATNLYSNVKEPFNAPEFYGQSESSPNTSDIIPFCNPINVRDADAKIIGQYTGYCWMYIFGLAAVTFPIQAYRPPNEWSPLVIKPKVTTTNTFYSMEARLYMVGNNEIVGSPYLNRIRYWLYSQAPTFSPNWTSPFFLKLGQIFGTNLDFPVDFNLITGGVTTIKFGLTSQQFLLTY